MFQQRSLPALLSSLALGVLLSSCSGGGSLPGTSTLPAENQSVLQSLRPDAATTALYLSDWYGKSVFRYVRNADGTLQSPAASSLVLSYNPGPIAIGFRRRSFCDR